MTKSEFLRQARQSFPNLIGAGNSFDDALKILTRRGLINEELIYQNKADKFPLESIERGIRYELEVMDVYDIHHPSQEQYKKARQRAIDNLGKDPLYYINKIAEGIKQPEQEETEGDLKKVEAGTKHTLKEGKYITEAPAEDNTQLNKKFLDLYIKYKDGNYQVRDKESGELKPGKKLAPETAASKACTVVRKSMNAPRFRPDRNTIASCSVGRGKLQYQGERDGVPTFNYAWSLKEATPRMQYKDNHVWTANEYKLAYVLAEFGKQGLQLIGQIYGIDNLSVKLLANTIIGTTDAGLRFAVDGMKKVIWNEQDEKWLASYFRNSKALEAFRELDGKSMNDCKAAISPERCSEEEAAAAQKAQAQIDSNKAAGSAEATSTTKKIVDRAFEDFKSNRTSIGKSIQDPVKADKAAFISVCKNLGYDPDDPRRATLWAYLRDRVNMNSQAVRDLDAKLGVNDSTAPKFKSRNLNAEGNVQEANSYGEISKDPIYIQFYQHYLKKAKEEKDPNAEKTARGKAKKAFVKYNEKKSMKEQQEKAILKEHIIGIIGKVLNEAATANLAQLSDENASVAELPGIINNLENVVTEIESFWIKEQQKIQGIFDQVGNIKNEDGLPVGYKFVQPMLESLKKDLEPVLAKITLDDLKLPEAPAPDQTQVNDPNAEANPNDPNAVPPVEPKQTVFSPAQEKEPLQEADVQKVLDNINDLGLSDEQKKKIIELSNAMHTAIRQNSGNMYFYARELHDYLDRVLPKTNSPLQESKKNKRYTK